MLICWSGKESLKKSVGKNMLHVLLFVLKIIGIILLAILGIAVLLVCVVLFVPLRYRIEAESDGTFDGIDAKVRVSWLWHLISGYALYREGRLDWQFRILWKKMNVEGKPEAKEENKTQEKENVRQESRREEAAVPQPESVREEEASKDEKCTVETVRDAEPGEAKKHVHTQRRKRKKTTVFEKITHTYQTICAKIKLFIERKELLAEFLTDTVHGLAFSRAKKKCCGSCAF